MTEMATATRPRTDDLAGTLGLVRAGPGDPGPTYHGWRLSDRKREALRLNGGDGFEETLRLRHLVRRLLVLEAEG